MYKTEIGMNSTINSIPNEQSECTCTRPLSSYDNLDTNALIFTPITTTENNTVSSSSSSSSQNHRYTYSYNNSNINNDNRSNTLMTSLMNGSNELEKSPLNLIPRIQTISSSSLQLSSSLTQNRNVNNIQKIANSDNSRFKVNSFNNSVTPSPPRSLMLTTTTATTITTTTTVVAATTSIAAALTPTAPTTTTTATSLPVLMTAAPTTQKLPDANSNTNNVDSKNIVFVRHTINKPVISDAKSKFFGFNQNYSGNNNSQKNLTVESGNEAIKLTTTEIMIATPAPLISTTVTTATTTKTIIPASIASATFNKSDIGDFNCDGNTRLLEKNCNKPSIALISSNCNTNTIISENQTINGDNSCVAIDNEKYSKNFDQPVVYHLHYQEQQQQQQQQQQELRDFSSSINYNNNNNSKTGNLKSDSMYETDINQPSQLVYMSTTVPQNIKGNDIAGRHTPTRNSLRHSRMLVVNNKNFQGPKSQNPLGLRYPNLTKILLILHIIFGTLLALIGFWILLWAPNTRLQDNPYWSGITLTLAGILGLIVVGFKRMRRHKLRENCFVFLKYDSYLLTLVASTLCFIAFICALIHLSNINSSKTKCVSTNILIDNAACTCIFGINVGTSAQSLSLSSSSDLSKNSTQSAINSGEVQEFYYRDLSCTEVYGAWKFILTVSVLLNALGFCVTILYIVSVFWKRKTKNMYTSVRTNPF